MGSPNHAIEPSHPADFRLVSPKTMTEEEFVRWCNQDTRAEWVDGAVVMMTPAGSEHVDLNGWLTSVLRVFVEHHDLGVVLGPEFQIRLPAQRRRRVPDVVFVAHEHRDRLFPTHLEGPPDLAVEIVSPDSEARDWREKYLEYEAAAVREYWIIDPASRHVEAYELVAEGASDERRFRRISEDQGVIPSSVLVGFRLRTDWLWAETRPKVLCALRDLGVLDS